MAETDLRSSWRPSGLRGKCASTRTRAGVEMPYHFGASSLFRILRFGVASLFFAHWGRVRYDGRAHFVCTLSISPHYRTRLGNISSPARTSIQRPRQGGVLPSRTRDLGASVAILRKSRNPRPKQFPAQIFLKVTIHRVDAVGASRAAWRPGSASHLSL